jgi:hypothetical protein
MIRVFTPATSIPRYGKPVKPRRRPHANQMSPQFVIINIILYARCSRDVEKTLDSAIHFHPTLPNGVTFLMLGRCVCSTPSHVRSAQITKYGRQSHDIQAASVPFVYRIQPAHDQSYASVIQRIRQFDSLRPFHSAARVL